MKKRSIILFLLLFLWIGGSSAMAATVYTEGTLKYTIADGSVTITGCFGREETVKVPAFIAGYPVNAVAQGAFAKNTDIKTVLLPDTVVSIEEGAFGDWITMSFYTDRGETPSPTPGPTPTPTPSPTPTATPSPTPTATPSPTPTTTPGPTPTLAPGETATPTPQVTATPTPQVTTTPDGTATPAAASVVEADYEERTVVLPDEEEVPDEEEASDAALTDTATVMTAKHSSPLWIIIISIVILGAAVSFIILRKKR